MWGTGKRWKGPILRERDKAATNLHTAEVTHRTVRVLCSKVTGAGRCSAWLNRRPEEDLAAIAERGERFTPDEPPVGSRSSHGSTVAVSSSATS